MKTKIVHSVKAETNRVGTSRANDKEGVLTS